LTSSAIAVSVEYLLVEGRTVDREELAHDLALHASTLLPLADWLLRAEALPSTEMLLPAAIAGSVRVRLAKLVGRTVGKTNESSKSSQPMQRQAVDDSDRRWTTGRA